MTKINSDLHLVLPLVCFTFDSVLLFSWTRWTKVTKTSRDHFCGKFRFIYVFSVRKKARSWSPMILHLSCVGDGNATSEDFTGQRYRHIPLAVEVHSCSEKTPLEVWYLTKDVCNTKTLDYSNIRCLGFRPELILFRDFNFQLSLSLVMALSEGLGRFVQTVSASGSDSAGWSKSLLGAGMQEGGCLYLFFGRPRSLC